MPYTDSAVEIALEKVRELLRPDGGDIVLAESAGSGTAADGAAADRAAADPAAADGAAADGTAADGTATDGAAADPASDATAADGTASDRTAVDPASDATATDPTATDSASDNALKLRLVVENSDCPECILPVDMLEPIALDIMSADLPGLTSVSISDPRAEEDRHV